MKTPLEVLRLYPLHDGSVCGAFHSRLRSRAGEPFLVYEGVTLSWREFGAAYERLARVLVARGIARGDRVAVMGRNHPVHVMALFALAHIGATMIPINPDFGQRELRHCLQLGDVQGVIAHADLMDTVVEAFTVLDRRPWALPFGGSARGEGTLEGEWAAAPDGELPRTGRADDTAVIIFTSGTTSFPKGVMHAQSSVVTVGEAYIARMHLQPADRVMVMLPFFHMNALFYMVGGALAAGACVIVVPRFSASTFWQTAADSRATVVNIIEAIGGMLVARDRAEYRPDHRLRAAYGVRNRLVDAFRGRFNIPHLLSGFGMTEIPGVTCNAFDGPNKPGSMGVLGTHPDPDRPWAQCRVVGPDGADVPVGEPGELWVKTPIVMQGYFRDPEQTRAAFHDGWLKTGDLVRRDADGFYFHLSRIKDVIRKRGENIAASELEAVVGDHPGVLESAALAVPSELGEDDILMVVLPRPGAEVTHRQVAELCRKHLAPIKVPRYVAFVDTMPHTATHKISKALLRADAHLREAMVDLQSAN